MFHRNGAPSHRNGPYPPTQVSVTYNHNPQRIEGANRAFHVLEQERLPPYVWSPPPYFAPAMVPPQKPALNYRRKRPNADNTPYFEKRLRLDPPSHATASPVLNWAPPPSRLPHQAVAALSTPALSCLDRFGPSRHISTPPQGQTVPKSFNSLQVYAGDHLSRQMVELFEACQQQSIDLERKEVFRARLQEDIQSIFSVARLYLTGSSMNGLGCRSSDADLCLVITGNKKPDPLSVLSRLRKLFRTLSYVEGTCLIRAKVPILKFKEKGSDLEFDLNINNTVGIRNTFLLRSYAHADPRVRPMILVVKKWACHHQINDASKGTLSSYTLVLMVLHYLQTVRDPVLPSLQRDHPDCFSPCMEIDMVPEGSTHVPPYISRNQSSLGELLLGFLRYYASEFSWDKQVISVREATAFPKTYAQEWRKKFICVEEPFERNNVARAVHEKLKFDAIKAQFFQSSRKLQARRDLNSILPLRAIINKEALRR
ncbi:poly(A) RNA polymerase GLD2 isoform X1 [Oryzias latipes]|uniref:poly(A) RNA polymerase GLD2 isoform X1 n=2 Tax=Oryzias latipes TaxID=8090 RepID=UPI0002A4A9EC|nr:poly(A) RNA polymerase GLD2 isoform X1 [Oryzias latipes]